MDETTDTVQDTSCKCSVKLAVVFVIFIDQMVNSGSSECLANA